jgi:hypothetical protein
VPKEKPVAAAVMPTMAAAPSKPQAQATVATTRKIGRGTVTAEVAEPMIQSAQPVAAAVEISAPLAVPELPSAKSAIENSVDKAHGEPVAVEPKSEPILAPSTEPKAAIAAVAKPVVEAKPEIDRSVVSSVVSAHRGEILKCFSEGKNRTQK